MLYKDHHISSNFINLKLPNFVKKIKKSFCFRAKLNNKNGMQRKQK